MIINGGSNALQQNLERIDYYNSAILYTNSYYGVSVSKWCLQASEIECRVILLSQQIGVTNLMHIYVPTLRLSFTPTCRKILLTTTKSVR